MHAQFAGDAKDHAKGFVLASLSAEIVELQLRIDPMFSDMPLPTGSDGLNAYCRFLRISPDQVINNDIRYHGLQAVVRGGRREDYFQPHYHQDYDLFLDPDTGFGDGGSSHVPWRVLPLLVLPQSPRVLAVFQSRHRVADFERHFTQPLVPAYDTFWVKLGQGAYVLFVAARKNRRLGLFRQVLQVAYHPHEASRVLWQQR